MGVDGGAAAGNNLPAPAWPADATAPPPVGACRLRGRRARVAAWVGAVRQVARRAAPPPLTGELVHRGYPTVWGIPPVCPYAYDAFEAWRI